MIVLDSTSRSLQIKLGGSVTTSQLPFTASYVDITSVGGTPDANTGQTNNASAVALVAAPSSSTERVVKTITVQNDDTAAASVTIIYNDNSTLRTLFTATLAAGDNLTYEDGDGFSVLDDTGAYKQSGGGGGGGGITALVGDVTASGSGSVSTTIASHVVGYAKMQQESASTLLGNPSGSLANVSEITLGTNLSFSGTTLNASGITALTGGVTASGTGSVAATVVTNANMTGDVTSVGNATTIASHAVTYGKVQQESATTLLGNPTGSLANIQEVTLGSTLSFSAGALTTIALTGDITASAGSFVTALANNAVITAKINNNAVTYGKVQQASATTLIGNPTGSLANVSEITLGTNLSFSGTTLNATGGGGGITALTGDVTASGTGSVAATIAGNAVTYAKIQQAGAAKILGNSTGGTANVQEISVGSGLQFSGSTLMTTGGAGVTLGQGYAFASGNFVM